jgi:hypothetical protein
LPFFITEFTLSKKTGFGIAALGRALTYRKMLSGTISAMIIAYKAFLFKIVL